MNRTTHEPIGLIAGAGRFPLYFAAKAKSVGIPVVCVGIAGLGDPALRDFCTVYRPTNRIALGTILSTFRKHGVKRWTMAGKLHKHQFFHPWRWLHFLPDWRIVRLWYLRNRSDRRDDSLLLSVIREFEDEGMICTSALELCPELLVKRGILTKKQPTARECRDIAFGWAMAKEMGRLDVGQSVMVKENAVLAVEAVEGTDRCIQRAGELCGRSGFVVVKVAKPKQDRRFDVPTVGLNTIEAMAAAGGTVLAVEAEQTILLDNADVIAAADRLGIAIVACDERWADTHAG